MHHTAELEISAVLLYELFQGGWVGGWVGRVDGWAGGWARELSVFVNNLKDQTGLSMFLYIK